MTHRRKTCLGALAATPILLLVLSLPTVASARCEVSSPTYIYPQLATPNQSIQVVTTLAGSCATTGWDYYALRVDLVDQNSSMILSESSVRIGYDTASNFTVTATNSATTPSTNQTWLLQVKTYLVRAGGTYGSNLLDYQNTTTLSVQVGTVTPVPEFKVGKVIALTIPLAVAAAIIATTKRRLRK